MPAERSRLTFDVDPALYDAVKKLAARKGTTMRQFCVDTLERRIHAEKTGYLTAETAPLLAELWDNDEDAVYDDAE